MSRKLPPLNALRAFEAAARHLSFTRAADELFVTQAAISHQVKALEDHLGIKLFKRLNRALMLSDEGQRYYPAVRDGLDQLANATEQLLKSDRDGLLTVSTTPSFASLWLVPRIQNFTRKYPEIDVRIAAEDRVVDFDRDDVDCAIRYGKGGWSNLFQTKLMDEKHFPVCSPHYLARYPGLTEPRALKNHTLLHDYAIISKEETWEHWLKKANATEVNASRGPKFSHTHMVIQACIAGEGIAIGRTTMIQAELDSGRLVPLFDVVVENDTTAFFVCKPKTEEKYKISVFRDWLLSEIKNL